MARDLVYGLKLNSDQFEKNAKKSKELLRDIAGQRMDVLRKELQELGKDGVQNATKIQQLSRELAKLEKVGAQTASAMKGGWKDAFSSVLKGGALAVGGAVAAAAAGVTGLVAVAIREGMASNRIDEELKDALSRINEGDAFGELDKLADRVKRSFRLEDEDVKAGFTSMIRGGMDAEQVMKATALAADIAKAKHMSFSDAANIVTRTFNGEVRGLKELGILIAQTGDKALDARAGWDALANAFGGLGSRLGASESPFASMKIAISDMLEQLGKGVIPVVMPVVQEISDAMQAGFSTQEWGAFMEGVIQRLHDTISWGLDIVKGFNFNEVWKSLWDIFTEVGKLLYDIFDTVATMLGNKIRESLPAVLGGGKSQDQKELDAAWEKYGSQSKEQMRWTVAGLKSEAADPNLNMFQRNRKEWDAHYAEMVLNDQRVYGARSIGDVLGEHADAMKGRLAANGNSGLFDQMAARGAAMRAQDQSAVYAAAGSPGVSNRAQAMSSRKFQNATKGKIARYNRGGGVPVSSVNIRLESYERMHPSMGTA